SRGRLIVELRNVTVTLRVVIVSVNYDLARKRLNRHAAVVLQRYRDHNDVTGSRRLNHRCGAGLGPEFIDQLRKGLRPARITDHDVIAICDGKACDLASDMPGADDTNC